MDSSTRCLVFALILILTAQPAAAYLDPGTGSYILQMLLGVVFAGLFTLKVYWERITGKLKSRFFGREDDRKAK